MTNGEKFKEIFPNIIKYGNILIDDTGALQKNILFDDTWWNAEYKEPTSKNDLGVDCISRQSVLDKIQRLVNAEQNNIDENGDYMNYARERVNAYEAIQFFVENDCLCPPVTPQEPRKGHWIPSHIPESILDECSECGFSCGAFTFNYCPNCGADMRTSEVKE